MLNKDFVQSRGNEVAGGVYWVLCRTCEIQHLNGCIVKGKEGHTRLCGTVPFAVLPQGRGKGKAILPRGSCTLLQPWSASLCPDRRHFGKKHEFRDFFFSCILSLPILTSGNKPGTEKESGGDVSRILSITGAFGSLCLLCSLLFLGAGPVVK